MNPITRPQNKAIGIFDSGIGGLTVAAEIFRRLPNENVIYFGDTGRYPYGPRSQAIIKKFSRQDVNFLLEQNVKFVVVACNTASAMALDYIKKICNIPIIGVIQPGAIAAANKTKSKRIGVIGTQGTIESSSYQRALRSLNSTFKIYSKACPLLVALAEEGYVNKPAARMIATDYLREMKRRKIDTLVLGCTHYPLLKRTIRQVMGTAVELIDSAEETTRALKAALLKLGLLNEGRRTGKKRFYVSDSPEKFKKIGERFLRRRIGKVELVDINTY
ncbi:MAG: glutamate racemase [candidate division Zixibacteria bacterium]